MFRLGFLTLRQWKKRPGRALLTVASVAVAVACVLASWLAQSLVTGAYHRTATAVSGEPALDLVSQTAQRFRIDQGELSLWRSRARQVVPLLYRATLVRGHGKRARALTVALDPLQAAPWDQLALVEGARCTQSGQVVVDENLARALGVKVADRVTLLGRRGPRAAEVVGIMKSDTLHHYRAGASVLLTLDFARETFGLAGQIDRLRLLLDTDADPKQELERLAPLVPEGFSLERPEGYDVALEETIRSTQLALDFSTALSLVMTIFIALNSLRMNFHERRGELALLRTLGASSRQISRLLLVECAAVGLVGSLCGIPLALALARGLVWVLGALIGEVPAPSINLASCGAAVLIGQVAVLAAGIWTIRQSRRITPVEAMREGESRPAEGFPWQVMSVAAVGWLVAALLLLALRGERLSSRAAIPAGLLMLGCYVLVLPAILPGLLRLLVGRRRGVLGLLAREQLLRRPVRTGLTAGVLVVAVSSGLGLGNTLVNHTRDVRRWYDSMMTADYFLFRADSGSSDRNAAAPPDPDHLTARLENLPGVARVVAARYLPVRLGTLNATAIVEDFHKLPRLPWPLDPSQHEALVDGLDRGEMVVSSVLAQKLGVAAGDTLPADFGPQRKDLRVAGVVNDYHFGGMTIYLASETARKWLVLAEPDLYLVTRQASAQADPGGELARLADENGWIFQELLAVRARFDTMVDGIIGALWGLIGVSFVVGGFGLANTLTMSVLEQTREIGLLRVVGLTRKQVVTLVAIESSLLGVAGIVLGGLAGLTTSLIIHWCSQPLVGRTVEFSVSLPLVALNVLLCLTVALAASLWPAWHAVRMPITRAISYE